MAAARAEAAAAQAQAAVNRVAAAAAPRAKFPPEYAPNYEHEDQFDANAEYYVDVSDEPSAPPPVPNATKAAPAAKKAALTTAGVKLVSSRDVDMLEGILYEASYRRRGGSHHAQERCPLSSGPLQ